MLSLPKPTTIQAPPVYPSLYAELVDEAICLALKEDIGSGDVTTNSVVPADATVAALVLYKQPAVVAGLRFFARVFELIDERVTVEYLLEEGFRVDCPPAIAARLVGPARSILTGERTALNILQRLSGVATVTRKFVDLTESSGIAVLNTRKTTPTLRGLERYAVTVGGGVNHRFGLFDAVLIKDNHVQFAGGVAQAVETVRRQKPGLRIEVETDSLEQVRQALACNADSILLDNMSPAMVTEAVALIDKKAFVEVSGGINANNIVNYLISGVDAISVGALTHSAPSIDISLDIEAR